MRVIITPNGKGNKFYELRAGKNDGWSHHVADIYQCVADGLPRDIDELRLGAGDEDLWAQEFELKWLDEASSWLEIVSSLAEVDNSILRKRGGGCLDIYKEVLNDDEVKSVFTQRQNSVISRE